MTSAPSPRSCELHHQGGQALAPPAAVGFGDRSEVHLPFWAVVVASENDPYGSLERSASVAECRAARLVNVGPLGHINAEPGLGDWPDGWAILREEFPE